MLIASLIPLAQSPENVAAGAIILRGRYDIRGGVPRGLDGRCASSGSPIGCRYGVVGARDRDGRRAGGRDRRDRRGRDRRVPPVPARRRPSRSRDDVRGAPAASWSPRRSPRRSTRPAGRSGPRSCRRSRRSSRPATSGTRRRPRPGSRRSPGPSRLVMLTEQTRDFEAGRHDRVHEDAAAATSRAPAALMVVAVPVLWIVMPFLIGLVYGPDFRAHATDAARLVLVAAALRLDLGLDEVVPGLDRAAGPARDRAERRDRRLRAAAARVRLQVGRDRAPPGRCSSRPSSSASLWTIVLLRLRAGVALGGGRRASEGPRRLGDLAAGRRRACVARAGGRGVPARRAGTRSRW